MPFQRRTLQRLGDHNQQMILLEGFREEIVCPVLHRLYRRFD